MCRARRRAPGPAPGRPLVAAVGLVAALLAGCPPVDAPSIEDLRVEANPACALTAFVRFSTDVPATARAAYGEGAPRWVRHGAPGATDHELVLIGLHADTEYVVEVTATGAEGRAGLAATSFVTGSLPFADVSFELTHDERARIQPGWTLTNLVVGSMLAPTIAIALDEDARPVWYHALGEDEGSGDVEVGWTADGHVSIGGGIGAGERPVVVDLAGRPRWQGPVQPDGIYATGGFHHTFRALGGGDHLALRYDVEGPQIDDRVDILDADGEVRWSWLASDHVAHLGAEYPHGNSVLWDDEAGVFYYGSRYASALVQLDGDSGEPNWTLGGDRDFTFVGEHDTPWFLRAHTRSVLPGGRVLMYDNGAPEDREWSRVVEYAIDEEARTARIAWEYPGSLADDPWFTFAWGDADRLDNGNTLVCAGTMVGRQSPSRIFEVTPDGDKVWQVMLAVGDREELAGSYMAARIPDPREPL